MKKQFVTYEIALRLKELGFNEECFGYYTPMKEWMMKGTKFNSERHFHGPNWANSDNTMRFMYVQNSFGDRDSVVKNSGFTKAVENIATPLWQQCMDWLREEHNIYIDISGRLIDSENKTFQWNVYGLFEETPGELYSGLDKDFNTARIQAIEIAIELIK